MVVVRMCSREPSSCMPSIIDPLYQGRLYPKDAEADLTWLIQLPRQWTMIQIVPELELTHPVTHCPQATIREPPPITSTICLKTLRYRVSCGSTQPFSFPNGVRRREKKHLFYRPRHPASLYSQEADANEVLQMREHRRLQTNTILRWTCHEAKGAHLILEVAEK